MAVDVGTALQVGSALTKFTFGLLGGGRAKARAKFDLENQLASLSLEEQGLALQYATTFIQGQEIELQAAWNEWQSEFQILKLEEETRQRNIDRSIQQEYTMAGLEKEELISTARLDYARAAEIKARDSWAVREGLLDGQYAVNIGLINEREALQVGQIERTAIRHDAALVVQAAASNLINRQLGGIRENQASVYDQEISLVQSSAEHARSQETFGLRMTKLDADERLAAFEMNKDLAIAELDASRKHAARVGRVQTFTDQELTNLGAWRGKIGDIIGQPEGPNLFFGADPGSYDGDDNLDLDGDGDIDLDDGDVYTEGVDPGSDDGQDPGGGRLDDELTELEEETLENIDEIVDPEQDDYKDSPLYKNYISKTQEVRRWMLRYGHQRLSGAFGRAVEEAMSAERALKLALGVDQLDYDESGVFTEWKHDTLQILLKARDEGKKGWRKSNLGAISLLQAEGADANQGEWYTSPGITRTAEKLTESSYYGSFISGDYTQEGLTAQGRLERSANLGTQPSNSPTSQSSDVNRPQFDSSPQGQGQAYYGTVDVLQSSSAGQPQSQLQGGSGIQGIAENPPTGAGGSFAIGPDGEAIPFVGAFDPSNEQRAGALTPDPVAVGELQRRWGLGLGSTGGARQS